MTHKLRCFKLFILSLIAIQLVGCSVTSLPKDKLPVSSVELQAPGRIAFTSSYGGKFSIYSINHDGSNLLELTSNLAFSSNPAWSPDGRFLTFSAFQDGPTQIYIMDVDGSNQIQLTHGKTGSYKPAWSPDGKHIVFLAQRGEISNKQSEHIQQAYLIRPTGSDEQKITKDGDFVDAVSWYPENRISITIADGRYLFKTHMENLDGIVQKQFAEFHSDGIPIWSPDGKLAVLGSTQADCYGIVFVRFDDLSRNCTLQVTPPSTYVNGISWSPDGTHIVFSSNIDGDYDLYVIKPDGSEMVQLTNLPGDEFEPAWGTAR